MAEYEIESLNKLFIIKKYVRNITTSSKISADGVGSVTLANITPSLEEIPGYTICAFRLFSSSNGYLHTIYLIPRGSNPGEQTTHYVARIHNKHTSAAPASTTAVFRVDAVYVKNDYFTEEPENA